MKLMSSIAAAIVLAVLAFFALGSPTTANAARDSNPQHASSSKQSNSNKHKPHKHKPHKHKCHKHKCKPRPYPGSVDTECKYSAAGSVKKNRPYYVKYAVKARGNARPTGVVKFSVYRYKNGHWEFVTSKSKSYTGPSSTSLGSFSKPGNYFTKMSFKPATGSVYEPSSSSRSFKVTGSY